MNAAWNDGNCRREAELRHQEDGARSVHQGGILLPKRHQSGRHISRIAVRNVLTGARKSCGLRADVPYPNANWSSGKVKEKRYGDIGN